MKEMIPFKITYSKWLDTHSRDHYSYQRRKRYNWGILSKINFNPDNFKISQEFFAQGTNGKHLGDVQLLLYELRDERYVFHIRVIDLGRSIENEFRVVFTKDGLPITIFEINDPIEKLKENFLNGYHEQLNLLISVKDAKDILVEIVSNLLIASRINYTKYKVFEEIEPCMTVKKAVESNGFILKEKKKYIPGFSDGRKHWIIVNIRAKKALADGLQLRSQCESITSLYLIEDANKKVEELSGFELVSLFKYFSNEVLLSYYQRLNILKRLIK